MLSVAAELVITVITDVLVARQASHLARKATGQFKDQTVTEHLVDPVVRMHFGYGVMKLGGHLQVLGMKLEKFGSEMYLEAANEVNLREAFKPQAKARMDLTQEFKRGFREAKAP